MPVAGIIQFFMSCHLGVFCSSVISEHGLEILNMFRSGVLDEI